MSTLRKIVDEMEQDEHELLDRRSEQTQSSYYSSIIADADNDDHCLAGDLPPSLGCCGDIGNRKLRRQRFCGRNANSFIRRSPASATPS